MYQYKREPLSIEEAIPVLRARQISSSTGQREVRPSSMMQTLTRDDAYNADRAVITRSGKKSSVLRSANYAPAAVYGNREIARHLQCGSGVGPRLVVRQSAIFVQF